MPAPFHKVFADEFKIPASSVRALIESCYARKQTGVIRLMSKDEESLYLLLKNGNVLNTYLVFHQAWKHISPEMGDAWIDLTGDAYTKFVPLPIQGLLVCKLLIQSTAGKAERFTRSVDIGEYLEEHNKAPGASLVHIEWENSMGAVLFSGSSTPPYSFFVSSDYNRADITSVVITPEDPNFAVTVFVLDSSVDAWQEYLLRRVFSNVCERILSQIQVLTGRALVDSLVRLVLAFVSRRKLNIEISSNKVTDNELFSSPQEAADNYRLLLTEMLVHASGITGSRLLSSTIRDIVANLPVEERAAITAYPLFTEGYVYERRN